MYKKIFILILIVLMSGCSASWHLERALQKDDSILDVKADTTQIDSIEYKDTTISVTDTVTVKLKSDTAFLDTVVYDTIEQKKCRFGKITAHSDDGIAHATVYHDGSLKLKAYATLDTVHVLQDSIDYLRKRYINQIIINKATKATINKRSFSDYIKTIAVKIAIGFIVLITLYLTIKKLFYGRTN